MKALTCAKANSASKLKWTLSALCYWHSAIGVVLLLWGMLHGAVAAESTAHSDELHMIEIERVNLFELRSSEAPSSHTLPARFTRKPRDLKSYRIVAEFTVADVSKANLWAVYLLSMNDGGQININGTTVGLVETASLKTAVRHVRPFVFLIPPSVLRSGRNTLDIEWSSNDTFMQVAKIFVGPESVVRKDFERRYFWQNTMAQVGFDFSLVNAAILFGIFAMRRREVKYFLMGTTALSWALVCVAYFLPPVPAPWFPIWCLVRIIGIALVTNCIWIFLMLEVNPKNRWFPKLCVLVGSVGPLQYIVNFAFTNETVSLQFEDIWGFSTVGLGIYPLWSLVRSLYQRWQWRNAVFLIATTAGLAAGLADMIMANTGSGVFGGLGYMAQIVSPLWYTAIGSILVNDFAHSVVEQNSLNKLMASKLTQQQAQLSELHERSLVREREASVLKERERIMQDIHDGLGSQLISSLVLSERGNLSAEQTSLLLRECIDDLRLAIDSMSGDHDNFCVLAGNLRFRMEPRLRAVGIALQWDVSALSDDLNIPTSKTLSLLRILQEAITNALKHAQASRILVTISSDHSSLVVRVEDNGVGFDPTLIRSGKGLPGLKKRAQQMGGHWNLQSKSGTSIEVTIAL